MSAAGKLGWRIVGTLSGFAAARVTRAALDRGWRGTRGTAPPRNPAAPGTSWPEALVWAAASGLALALSQLIATRGAAAAWEHSTGHLPPGLEDVGA